MIRWYMEDTRFKPGTVADQGDIRLTLRQPQKRVKDSGNYKYVTITDVWRLYVAVRFYKENGANKDGLGKDVKVAEFKNCSSLQDAQRKVEKWLLNFVGGLF